MVVSTPKRMYAIFVNETVDRTNNASPRWSIDPITHVRDFINEMVVSTPQRMYAIFVNETVDRPNNVSPRWSTDPITRVRDGRLTQKRVRDLWNEMVVSTP